MNDLEYFSKYTYNIEQRIWIVYMVMVTMMMNTQNGISVTITTTTNTTFAKAD